MSDQAQEPEVVVWVPHTDVGWARLGSDIAEAIRRLGAQPGWEIRLRIGRQTPPPTRRRPNPRPRP